MNTGKKKQIPNKKSQHEDKIQKVKSRLELRMAQKGEMGRETFLEEGKNEKTFRIKKKDLSREQVKSQRESQRFPPVREV